MLYVFLNIFCSIIVYVLLKLSKRYHIDVLQAVTWSFSTNILLGCLVYKPQFPAGFFVPITDNNYSGTVNLLFSPVFLYLALGFLFPVMLMLLKSSIQATGITLTVISDRLALFISVLASVFVYGGQLNNLKITGIVLALCAIVCSIPWRKARGAKRSTNSWFYLLIVFVIMGVINILLEQTTQLKTPFTTSLFIIYTLAFAISIVFVLIQIFRKKTKFSIPHIIIGWILGAASFGSMAFYLQAQKELNNRPTVVFTAMHIGIITLGTLVGLLVFDEKLSKMNKIAIFFALVAIIIIAKA